MNRLEQIQNRLEELRTMLNDDNKRGKTSFKKIEEEVRELNAERSLLKRQAELGNYSPGMDLNDSISSSEYRSFLETREAAEGLKTKDGFVPVPTDEIQEIKKLKEAEFQLKSLVNIRTVSTGKGTLPIVRTSVEPMATVKELEKNPHLAVTPYTQVPFEIDTYRTSVPISNELLEDAEVDVSKEVREYFTKLSVATENAQILDTVLHGDGERIFETIPAKDDDDIKSIINLNVAPNYSPTIVMNQTSYDTVSKWKDNNGRYLMHELADSQAKTLLGFNVIVAPNKLLEGNKIIVGDFKEAVTFFDRSKYEVAYEMFEHFGLGLMLAIRFGVEIVDTDALVIIDLDGEVA